MSRLKKVTLFRRGKRTTSKYHPLDYEGGYEFGPGVAYGQVNQVLDLAAQDPKNSDQYVKVADRWLKVIEALDEEAEEKHTPIGFYVNRGEETEDDSTESDQST